MDMSKGTSKGDMPDALVITRVFDAPREVVWKAWTDPELVKQWWGPQYFTAPVIKIDLRVAGRYLYNMRSPDGQDFWSTGIFREIVPPERITATDSFADEQGNIVPASHYSLPDDFPSELLMTVLFEEYNGKTRLTLRSIGLPPGIQMELAREGWSTSLDKLEQLLKELVAQPT